MSDDFKFIKVEEVPTDSGFVTVVSVTDTRLTGKERIAAIGRELAVIGRDEEKKKVVIVLTSEFMSAGMLSELVLLKKRLVQRQGQLRLCEIKPAIRKLFHITGLLAEFDIRPTREEAIGSLVE